MPDPWSDPDPVVRLLVGRKTLAVLSELAQRSPVEVLVVAQLPMDRTVTR